MQAAYPLQSVGMVAYIYVPATVTFSAMLFGATLWLRRIIGDLIFGGCARRACGASPSPSVRARVPRPTPPRAAVMRHAPPLYGSVFLGLVLATLVGTVRSRANGAARWAAVTPGVHAPFCTRYGIPPVCAGRYSCRRCTCRASPRSGSTCPAPRHPQARGGPT